MPDSRARIWFSLFVLAVFGVGLASGVLLGRGMVRPDGPAFRNPPGPPGLGGGLRGGRPPAVLLDRLDRELSLTDDQRTRIQAVLDTSRTRLDRFQQETRSRFDGEQRSLRGEIRGLLAPDQQQKFDRWIDENPPPRGPGRRGRPESPGRLP